MGVSPTGGHDGRVGFTGGGDLRLPPPEHGCTDRCNQTHHGPVSGDVTEAGVKVGQAVVGARLLGFGGDVDGGSRGETDGGGGGNMTETETD